MQENNKWNRACRFWLVDGGVQLTILFHVVKFLRRPSLEVVRPSAHYIMRDDRAFSLVIDRICIVLVCAVPPDLYGFDCREGRRSDKHRSGNRHDHPNHLNSPNLAMLDIGLVSDVSGDVRGERSSIRNHS